MYSKTIREAGDKKAHKQALDNPKPVMRMTREKLIVRLFRSLLKRSLK